MQLESARHDLLQRKDQLEAQTESAKVASTQCKSAQTELKTLRQQLVSHSHSSLSGQSDLESAKLELAAQLEAVSRELEHQTELAHNSQAELSAVKRELEGTRNELGSVGKQHRLHTEASQAQMEQVQRKMSDLKTQVEEQDEQLKGAEAEAVEANRDREQLKVRVFL